MRVAAADWSLHPRKRWVCVAEGVVVSAPQQVTDAASLLVGDGPAVVGFDFPIGLPEAYCRGAGITDFPSVLAREWRASNEPSLAQPFYPHAPGGRSKRVLEQALELESRQWLRECDRLTGAGALFWTLGPKQVGKAAITGWREVLRQRPDGWKLWPFDEVDVQRDRWVAEIYPALAYRLMHLPANFGKRKQDARRAQAAKMLAFAEGLELRLSDQLTASVLDGFGASAAGEDPFDAFTGLLGMVDSLRRVPFPHAPPQDAVRRREGWILGLTDKTITLGGGIWLDNKT